MSDGNNSIRLDGKVAIVTGGGRGIGKAIAGQLLQAGAKVAIAGRKKATLDAAVNEIGDSTRTFAVECHVGKADQLAALVDATREKFGPIDILVNNAATNIARAPTLEVTDDMFDKMIETNLKSVFRLVRLVIGDMIASKNGSILNISSIAGLRADVSGLVYGMTKAAMNSLTAGWAREFGQHGIRVNAIAPGLIRTDFSAALWKDESLKDHILSQQAIPHFAEPNDIAGLAAFLVSDAARFITGQVLIADGGLTI